MLSELRPTELYLNRLFIEKHATKWRNIGLELSIASEALDIIKVDYPTDVQARCRATLKAWLQKDPEASWEQLLHAVEATDKDHHKDSVETGEIYYNVCYSLLLYEEFIICIKEESFLLANSLHKCVIQNYVFPLLFTCNHM